MSTEVSERRQCVDCPTGSRSAAKFPGPRCRSHHSRKQREASERQHDRTVLTKYGITGEQYRAIYEAQDRCCAICRLAIGWRKRLAVDHDHTCCPGPKSCGKCVRGLLCSACNRFLMIVRDNPEAFLRGYEYLTTPPAQAVLGERRTDDAYRQKPPEVNR